MIISIITINFNNLTGLKKTVESVLSQSYELIEYIIIDGGSSDGSKEYIVEHSEKIDYWVSENDKGVYHAMNKGLEVATGDYCLFLNSGDFFYNSNVVKLFQKEIDVCSSLVYGMIKWEETNQLWNPKRDLKAFEMAFHSLIPHQATFFKTDVIKNLGGYKEEFKVISDWGLMISIIEKKFKSQKIDQIISFCENQGISSKLEDLIRKERYQYLIKYNLITLIKAYLFNLKRYFFSK